MRNEDWERFIGGASFDRKRAEALGTEDEFLEEETARETDAKEKNAAQLQEKIQNIDKTIAEIERLERFNEERDEALLWSVATGGSLALFIILIMGLGIGTLPWKGLPLLNGFWDFQMALAFFLPIVGISLLCWTKKEREESEKSFKCQDDPPLAWLAAAMSVLGFINLLVAIFTLGMSECYSWEICALFMFVYFVFFASALAISGGLYLRFQKWKGRLRTARRQKKEKFQEKNLILAELNRVNQKITELKATQEKCAVIKRMVGIADETKTDESKAAEEKADQLREQIQEAEKTVEISENQEKLSKERDEAISASWTNGLIIAVIIGIFFFGWAEKLTGWTNHEVLNGIWTILLTAAIFFILTGVSYFKEVYQNSERSFSLYDDPALKDLMTLMCAFGVAGIIVASIIANCSWRWGTLALPLAATGQTWVILWMRSLYRKKGEWEKKLREFQKQKEEAVREQEESIAELKEIEESIPQIKKKEERYARKKRMEEIQARKERLIKKWAGGSPETQENDAMKDSDGDAWREDDFGKDGDWLKEPKDNDESAKKTETLGKTAKINKNGKRRRILRWAGLILGIADLALILLLTAQTGGREDQEFFLGIGAALWFLVPISMMAGYSVSDP